MGVYASRFTELLFMPSSILSHMPSLSFIIDFCTFLVEGVLLQLLENGTNSKK